MYSDRFNTVFIHIPKTAGQSIEHIFLDRLGLSWREREPLLLRPNEDPAKGPPQLAHLYAREYVELGYVPADAFARAFRFTVVRDPYKRALSQFRYRARPGLTYRRFVNTLENKLEHRHLAPQARFVLDGEGKMMVDSVIRFEALNEGVAEVTKQIFGEAIALPHVNKSTSAIPEEASDPEVRRKVYKLYEQDFDLFGYPSGL